MTTKLTILTLAVVLTVGLVAPAGAEILESSFHIWPTVNDWRRDVTVEQFHPDYGVLNSVSVTLQGRFDGNFHHENQSAEPATWSDSIAFDMTVDWTGGRLIGFDADYAAQGDLNEYDGVLDFGGPSGNVHPFLIPITAGITRQTGLGAFIGTNLIHLDVNAWAEPLVSQSRSGTQGAVSRSSVTITFVYNYTPAAVHNQDATWSQVKSLYR